MERAILRFHSPDPALPNGKLLFFDSLMRVFSNLDALFPDPSKQEDYIRAKPRCL
jgi:hypothetical protein